MNRGEGEFKRGEGELNRGEGKVDLESYSNGCRGAMRALEGLWRELPAKDRFHFVFVFYIDPVVLGSGLSPGCPLWERGNSQRYPAGNILNVGNGKCLQVKDNAEGLISKYFL